MAADETALLNAYRPSLITIGANLVAVAFPLMKIFPAEFCIRRALEEGALDADGVVLESSSGTMALGLALVCNWRRLRLTIVTDPGCSEIALQRRLTDLGARVEIVPRPAPTGGYQGARLERLRDLLERTRGSWWLNQYDNPGNPASYARVAAQMVEAVGQIDCLVGSVGTGGSTCGLARHLRLLFPSLVTVGVDTFGSVLFGQPDGPRQLRGLGNSLMPANLDHTVFDEVHWVTAAEAYHATRALHRRTSLFRGGSSGATWLVAQHYAATHAGKKVVCLLPDDGHRYVSTIYDDDYLQQQDLRLTELPAGPIEVADPRATPFQWAMFRWNRRSYAQATGGKQEAPSDAVPSAAEIMAGV